MAFKVPTLTFTGSLLALLQNTQGKVSETMASNFRKHDQIGPTYIIKA